MPTREEIARILEPRFWHMVDDTPLEDHETGIKGRIDDSLAKADAILDLDWNERLQVAGALSWAIGHMQGCRGEVPQFLLDALATLGVGEAEIKGGPDGR